MPRGVDALLKMQYGWAVTRWLQVGSVDRNGQCWSIYRVNRVHRVNRVNRVDASQVGSVGSIVDMINIQIKKWKKASACAFDVDIMGM